ncbi:MAG: RnfH family protein [Burkholderiales bacterium]
MQVEVIYAMSDRAWIRRQFDLEVTATVRAALAMSGILDECPEIDFSAGYGLAIHGSPAEIDQPLRCGDRVEIVRPLRVDPKEARRARARKRRAGAGWSNEA